MSEIETKVQILEEDNLSEYYETQSMHSHLQDLTDVVNTSFMVFKEAKIEWLSVKDKTDNLERIASTRKRMDIWAKNFIKSCAVKSIIIRDMKESKKENSRIKYLSNER